MWEISIETVLRELILDSSSSGYGPVPDSCEHGDENSGIPVTCGLGEGIKIRCLLRDVTRGQWKTLMNIIMKIRVLQMAGNFLTS
jgi:hypothetical protein